LAGSRAHSGADWDCASRSAAPSSSRCHPFETEGLPLTEAEDERDNPSNAVPLALGRFNQLLNLEHRVGLVLDSRGGKNLEKSLTVLKPGGQAISVTGPPDPEFAKQLGAPKFMGVVMGLLSRKVHNQARKLGVSYSFLFMQANGGQLRELASLYDVGHLRPLIDKTFPFDQTLEVLAYVEQGRANGKVVITLD
jgi:NADPH:quinone reductase-like Zn-dependent oxidoreductase